MGKESIERYLTEQNIPPEVFLLEETFGIRFKNPPKSKRLTLPATYRIVTSELGQIKFSGAFKFLLRTALPLLVPLIHMRVEGMYSGHENTFYQRKSKSKSRNLFREKRVKAPDYQRFTAIHELTHAYLREQGQDKGKSLLAFTNSLEQGTVPANFETIVTEEIWNEGVCTFTAIYIEEELIRQGKLDPRDSEALQCKYFSLTGKENEDKSEVDTIDIFGIEPNKDWIQECHDRLGQDLARVQSMNLTRLYGNSNRVFLELRLPSIPMSMTYAIGYQSSLGAFEYLKSLGFSPEESFQHIASHTPKTVYDLIHPASFVNFTLNKSPHSQPVPARHNSAPGFARSETEFAAGRCRMVPGQNNFD